MMTSRRIQPWRWFVKGLQTLIVLGLPFITMGGNSALRFDVPSLTLHLFGSQIAMDELFPVLVALLFLIFLFITLTILLGRVWCGWLCPQTVIIDFTRFVDRGARQGKLTRASGFLAVLALSPLLAASILWYFVPPLEFFRRLISGDLGPVVGWSWAVLSSVTFLNFAFLRHSFCSSACPYAKMQGSLFDDRTLVIAPDRERMEACMQCDACVRTCPVDIDVRKGLNAACINCAECIDACADRMERRGMPSLIGYRFGTGTSSGPLFRRPVLLSGGVAALFLGLLVLLAFARQPFEMDVLTDPGKGPVRTQGGKLINSYVLSLSNRTATEIELSIFADPSAGKTAVYPARILLPGRAHLRAPVSVIRDEREGAIAGPETVTITARAKQFPKVSVEGQVSMLPPW